MFKFLFGKSSPTRTWRPYSGQPLILDLDTGSLNGNKLGQRLEDLSFLGPDENRDSFRYGEFCYYSLGLCVQCYGSEYTIESYGIVFRDPEEQKYQPFGGRVVYDGRTIDLASVTLDQCADVFGEYFWLDSDEEESIVFYEFTDYEWQIEFDANSSFKRFLVTNRPLLADEEQRKAYHVTKPWPPSK